MSFWDWYLRFCVASLYASAVVAAYLFLLSPFYHFEMLILTNVVHEGLLEFFLAGASLPGWAVLFYRHVLAARDLTL